MTLGQGRSMFEFNHLVCQFKQCHLPPSLSHTAALMDVYCEHMFAKATITFMNQPIITRPCLHLHHYNFHEYVNILGGLG
jgi:hypothetical protein